MTDNDALKFYENIKSKSGLHWNSFYKKYPEYFNYFKNRFKDIKVNDSISEIYYRIKNHIEEKPKCQVCGKYLHFKNLKRGYFAFCSKECQQTKKGREITNKRRKALCIQRYGVTSYMLLDKVKEKFHKTMKQRYGVNNALENKKLAEKAKKHLIDKTKKEKEKIRKKIEKTNLEKYGVKAPFLQKKYIKTHIEREHNQSILFWKNKGYNIKYIDNNNILLYNGCKIHGNIILDKKTFQNRIKKDRSALSPICPICNPIIKKGNSYLENFIYEFLKNNHINFEYHNREILEGKELDFYIPTFNLAIECNGIYWHCDLYKDKFYHYKKALKCLEKDIKLIQIWEDDFANNKEKIVNELKNELKLNQEILITNIEKIEFKVAKLYIEDNYKEIIKKPINTLKILFNKEIYGILLFKKYKKNINIIKLYIKEGIYIKNLYTDLLRYFKKEYNNYEIKIKEDLDNSNALLYKQLGFKIEKIYNPDYTLLNKEKTKRIDKKEIINNFKYYKCYNSGYIKMSLLLN